MSFCFVYSASSYTTLIEPKDAFFIMKCIKAKAGLASSYDLYKLKNSSKGRDKYYEYIDNIKKFTFGEIRNLY